MQSADEKSIKRHYKRLSLKFHPDKLKLKENQTAEEANAHFVDLTKAYKSCGPLPTLFSGCTDRSLIAG